MGTLSSLLLGSSDGTNLTSCHSHFFLHSHFIREMVKAKTNQMGRYIYLMSKLV